MTKVEKLKQIMSRDGGWRSWSYIDYEIRNLFGVSLEDILDAYEREHGDEYK